MLVVRSQTSTRFSFGAALHRLAMELGPGRPSAGPKASPPVRRTHDFAVACVTPLCYYMPQLRHVISSQVNAVAVVCDM